MSSTKNKKILRVKMHIFFIVLLPLQSECSTLNIQKVMFKKNIISNQELINVILQANSPFS